MKLLVVSSANPIFLSIAKQLSVLVSDKFPVLVSRLPFKSSLGFDLPFAFNQTSAGIQQLVTSNDWINICEYSTPLTDDHLYQFKMK